MLALRPKSGATEQLAELLQPVVEGLEQTQWSIQPTGIGRLRLDQVTVEIRQIPEDREALQQLIEASQEALAWVESGLCSLCHEDYPEQGQLCWRCADLPSTDEHLEADLRERLADARGVA